MWTTQAHGGGRASAVGSVGSLGLAELLRR
jgi:hypothetical protein